MSLRPFSLTFRYLTLRPQQTSELLEYRGVQAHISPLITVTRPSYGITFFFCARNARNTRDISRELFERRRREEIYRR